MVVEEEVSGRLCSIRFVKVAISSFRSSCETSAVLVETGRDVVERLRAEDLFIACFCAIYELRNLRPSDPAAEDAVVALLLPVKSGDMFLTGPVSADWFVDEDQDRSVEAMELWPVAVDVMLPEAAKDESDALAVDGVADGLVIAGDETSGSSLLYVIDVGAGVYD
jgi:hypothetical protein